ncbi:flagellar hook-associated family protein [Microvirga lenta]|uniref:flagellar hook-associated family protein n=1 Tax=Microvirga lenta TaxID=2881337 RepID=UPI001CFF7C7D|nr:flagellar hook-associated family protein [Microvirga lenta]MCB5177729.1 flagellar hook-associated family protein [Microvirga lenta]
MRTTFISTLNLLNSPRTTAAKLQVELAKANTEIATGRHADVGLELGHRTGQSITLRQERTELDAIIGANSLTSIRLSVTKISLDNVREAADEFLKTILAVPSHPSGGSIIRESGQSNLASLIAELNQSANGQYIFAGTDTKQRPVAEYTGTSAAKAAVDSAFITAFGFSQTSAGVGSISPSQMETFLDGPFATLFNDSNWQSNWSSAGNQNIESRISPTEKIETSTNANEPAFRKLAMAYTMASDLGIAELPDETRKVVIDRLVKIMGAATAEIIEVQAELGTAEKKITNANERLDLQKVYFDEGVGKLESVDPAEAKTRVDALTTQIQMSYSLTSQLRQLNLFNYL